MGRMARWTRIMLTLSLVGGLSLPGLSQDSAAAAPGSAAAARGASPGPALHGAGASFTSRNWDGYITYLANEATDFTTVEASWIQPTVTCTQPTAWTVFWIGFDGWWNDTVEQGGTSAQCVNGVPRYRAWWEMYPTYAIQSAFAIAPGNRINASVTYQASTADYVIRVRDVTTGHSLTKSIKCAAGLTCDRDSADFIAEDVGHYPGSGYFPLADYNKVVFYAASITNRAQHSGSISDATWQHAAVTESSATTTYATVSALNGTGSAFTGYWKHA